MLPALWCADTHLSGSDIRRMIRLSSSRRFLFKCWTSRARDVRRLAEPNRALLRSRPDRRATGAPHLLLEALLWSPLSFRSPCRWDSMSVSGLSSPPKLGDFGVSTEIGSRQGRRRDASPMIDSAAYARYWFGFPGERCPPPSQCGRPGVSRARLEPYRIRVLPLYAARWSSTRRTTAAGVNNSVLPIQRAQCPVSLFLSGQAQLQTKLARDDRPAQRPRPRHPPPRRRLADRGGFLRASVLCPKSFDSGFCVIRPLWVWLLASRLTTADAMRHPTCDGLCNPLETNLRYRTLGGRRTTSSSGGCWPASCRGPAARPLAVRSRSHGRRSCPRSRCT